MQDEIRILYYHGGFVHESPNYGTFKRFKKTKAELYSLEVTDEQFYKINEIVTNFEKHKNKYSYNIIGLFFAGMNKIYKSKNKMYCTEFMNYLFDEANIETGIKNLMKPEDFRKLENIKLEYTGLLKNYNKKINFSIAS